MSKNCFKEIYVKIDIKTKSYQTLFILLAFLAILLYTKNPVFMVVLNLSRVIGFLPGSKLELLVIAIFYGNAILIADRVIIFILAVFYLIFHGDKLRK